MGEDCNVTFRSSEKLPPVKADPGQLDQVLLNLAHRGACGCDPETGDGAGVLIQIPHRFFARASEKLGFTLEELKILIVQGFKSAFLPYREKSALLRKVNDALAELTGSLPRGAVLAREVDRDDLPEAFAQAGLGVDTDRV